MKINKISVRGARQTFLTPADSSENVIQKRESFVLGAATRGGSEKHEIKLKDNDLVELVFDDDTTWFCNSDTLEEVFPEASEKNRSGDGAFEIPLSLRGGDSDRGLFDEALLKVFNVFTKKVITTAVKEKVRDLAADLEKKQLENLSGLYSLDSSFQLQKLIPIQTDKPYLLFLHGTASTTKGSFGGLIDTELWKYIQDNYGNNVLAFQHETLTKSPLQNVLELVKQLPQNISLHIISHSRGGLLGDILSRFSNNDENNKGFDSNEIEYLNKKDIKRNDDIKHINGIKEELKNRKIVVNKFVRIACPAGGTTLASNRLDNFFNITFNLIGYGTGAITSPVYLAFKNLIAVVMDCKNDETVLPGLEAMDPNSAFIKVLNNPKSKVELDKPLTVIAGNCKLKLNLKALLIIASRLFYAKRNDLVVNTGSMYKGAKRQNALQYFFDETSDVDHFHYFKNKNTNDAIMRALKSSDGSKIPGFTELAYESISEMDRNAILKLEGGQVFKDTVTGKKPIVVLLPGIMGSNLSAEDEITWINYFKFITGKLKDLDISSKNIKAPSLIKTSYEKIVEYLSKSYDVITFPYDWRNNLNETSQLLNIKIDKLLKYNLPVKIIGHSMGGVLVRDFIINYPDTWQRLKQNLGFKLIFLGAPLGGSFKIPAVLCGKEAVIDKLSAVDIFHTKKDLVKLFSKMPGILCLLPYATNDGKDFSNMATWNEMSSGLGEDNWPKPQQKSLTEFHNYRDAVNKNLAQIDYTNMVYIAGKDKATLSGYRIDKTNSGDELVFLSTGEGDQSVTWETGIPKQMIENDTVYYVDVTHGALANEPSMFRGITEILEKGFTNLFTKKKPVVRGEAKEFKAPKTYDFDLTPGGIEKTLLGLETADKKDKPSEIHVSVCNGDLRYSSYPILAGHFLKDGILYAEKAIDWNLKGALSERNRLGIYPGYIGTSEIFISSDEDFTGAVIVGLGKQGDLTAFRLTQTIEQGVSKYLLNMNSDVLRKNYDPGNSGDIGITSLIIGCGYGGLPIENSVRAVIQGVQNANDKIRSLHGETAKLVVNIEFIELYEDTALGCFYSLSRIEKEESRTLNIILDRRVIRTFLGAKRRVLTEMMSDGWWNRITVELKTVSGLPDDIKCLSFSASTGGAREEQQDLFISTGIVEQLIENISTNNNWSANLARTIFELLIPNEFKEQLKRQGDINWILDKDTAAFPWELLQDSSTGALPLCINAGMIRQLITKDYRPKINMVVKDNALIIADPELNGFLNQLPGALKEGELVKKILKENDISETTISKGSSDEIIQALFQNDYKFIHLAGHGVFQEKLLDKSKKSSKDFFEKTGMVIGKDAYLSTREIKQMSTVPELVFVNCCSLGKTDGIAEEYYSKRYKLAANIGTQLIEIGVKAVIVAGWKVNDSAAFDFTKVFYESMFAGYNFGEAIQKARKNLYTKNGSSNNTWGAYQCYGDPYYKFKNRNGAKKTYVPEFIISEEAEVELGNLSNEMQTGEYPEEYFLDKLSAISKAVDKVGLRNGKITELEAAIYEDLGEYNLAIEKIESLLKTSETSFSVSTLEKFNNIRTKKYVQDFLKSDVNKKLLLTKTNRAIKDLKNIIEMGETAERYGLLGSAYKRKSIMSGNAAQRKNALEASAYYYKKANELQDTAYTLTNWLEMESLLVLTNKRKWEQTVKFGNKSYKLLSFPNAVKSLNQIIDLKTSLDKMDYWKMLEASNIKLCLLIVNPSDIENQSVRDDVINSYRKIWKKTGTKGKKLAEIEHFELLINNLSLCKSKNAKNLNDRIKQLKMELEK